MARCRRFGVSYFIAIDFTVPWSECTDGCVLSAYYVTCTYFCLRTRAWPSRMRRVNGKEADDAAAMRLFLRAAGRIFYRNFCAFHVVVVTVMEHLKCTRGFPTEPRKCLQLRNVLQLPDTVNCPYQRSPFIILYL